MTQFALPKVCPRCRGAMIPERDWYGQYSTCLCCGYVHEAVPRRQSIYWKRRRTVTASGDGSPPTGRSASSNHSIRLFRVAKHPVPRRVALLRILLGASA